MNIVTPPANTFVEGLLDMIEQAGDGYNGMESVSQRAHAFQCGQLSDDSQAPTSLIAAAFLHDIGHLLGKGEVLLAKQGIDGRHEDAGADYLASFFPEEVTEPIRLHVVAKRYLCFSEPEYMVDLSPASLTSLRVQGGPFSDEEAEQFLKQPFAPESIALRAWDDQAKVANMAVPDVSYFREVLKANVK